MNLNYYYFLLLLNVSWLNVHRPSITNKAKIHDYMERTFDYREQQILVTLTCALQILKEYPRCVDFGNGSLIIHTINLFNYLLFFMVFIENIRRHTPAWNRVSLDGSIHL